MIEELIKLFALLIAVGLTLSLWFVKPLRQQVFTAAVLTCVLAAFLYPIVFTRWGSFELKALIVPLIQLIMFGMGATLALADFARVLKMPWAVLVGLLLQFTVMPLLGFGLAKAFGFEPSVAAGVILIGSCPGGVASNLITFLSKGNVALSVTMTACSTLIAPIMTPFWMSTLAGAMVEIVFIDWVRDILLVIIVPISFGLIANALLQKWNCRGPWVDRSLSLIAMAGICFIIAIIIATSRDKLRSVGLALIAAAVIHNVVGYLLGYWGAALAKLDESSRRTVAIEVGMQNGGMASTLAMNTLDNASAALAPALFGPWMNVSGSLLASWWSRKAIEAESTPAAGQITIHPTEGQI